MIVELAKHENPRPTGRGGTTSVVGEGLDQMRKRCGKLEICRNSLIRLSATFSLREKASFESL
jgi:hypothetical protein